MKRSGESGLSTDHLECQQHVAVETESQMADNQDARRQDNADVSSPKRTVVLDPPTIPRRESPRSIFGSYWQKGGSPVRTNSATTTTTRILLPTNIREDTEEDGDMKGPVSMQLRTERIAPLIATRASAMQSKRSVSAPDLHSHDELRSCLRRSSLLNEGMLEKPEALRRSRSSVSFSSEVRVTEFRRPDEHWAPDHWEKRFSN